MFAAKPDMEGMFPHTQAKGLDRLAVRRQVLDQPALREDAPIRRLCLDAPIDRADTMHDDHQSSSW
jgi:hypothetical protein